jgi:hypothetical protein
MAVVYDRAASAVRSNGYAEMTAATAALVLAVFRVACNEGALVNLREVSIVYQVTQSHGRSSGERLAWLRRHSPRSCCARRDEGLGPSASRAKGNQTWTSQLLPSCEKPEALDVSKAWWEARRRASCFAVYHLAEALVTARIEDKPCDGAPTTWAAPWYRARPLAQGMIEHHCEGVLNRAWSWPPRRKSRSPE